MSSIICGRSSCVGIGASRMRPDEAEVSSAGVRNAPRLLAVALMAATLAACAQPSVVTDKPRSLATNRLASSEPIRNASFVPNRHATVVTKRRALFANHKHAADTQDASYGLASFYSHDPQTASGERFDARELTAAHRTLPFGRSVTVRVNDRGPFVPGRILDVSHFAAETLGIVGQGVAKVKLDVVQ